MLAVMDRLFYAGGDAFAHKPAAAVVPARRAGTTASLDAVSYTHLDVYKRQRQDSALEMVTQRA